MTTTHIPEHAEIPPPAIEEVSKGIYAYVQLDGSWGLNNAGLLVGDDGVTVIDTCFTEARSRAFLAAIAATTDRPMRTLVNTHHHGDHTHGNYLLPAATIIGHELCRQTVIETGIGTSALFPGVQWGQLKVAPPFVTFRDRLNLYVDDLQVELIHVGPAHTTNDVVAWIPARRLLFSGDVIFNGGTPFVIQGSLAGSLEALETLRALGPQRIVPGHGPVCGPEVIDEVAAYLRFVQEVARKGFEAGRAPLDLARDTDLERFQGWHDGERLVANLHRAYSELRGEARGTPLDGRTVYPDMLACNGDRPLRCLA
jgi:cyclase